MELIKNLFGEISFGAYLAFGFFTIFGMAWIKIARYNIKKKKLLRAVPPERLKFSRKTWRDDNLLDFVTALMASFGIFRFFPDAFSFMNKFEAVPQFTDKMFYGLLIGLFFQYLFHKWMNKVKL